MKSAKRDQLNMIKRKEMIEHRKEYYENLNTEKERAELQEREKTRREAEKAETKRRDEEEKRRTEERSAREEKHKDKLLKMEKVKKLMEQVSAIVCIAGQIVSLCKCNLIVLFWINQESHDHILIWEKLGIDIDTKSCDIPKKLALLIKNIISQRIVESTFDVP